MSQYYKKYMKKREEEKPSDFKLFIGAFLVIIAFFAILVTHLSLSMDTNIGENDEGGMKESGLGVKHLIDSRLRFIQMEDISGNTSTTQKTQDNNNLERYGRTVQEEAQKGYSGQYQNSYGYDTTQQARPYSQTYTTTQKAVSQPVSRPKATSYQAPVSIPTATPTTHRATTSAPAPHSTSSTPAHNIQKNLAPTGF